MATREKSTAFLTALSVFLLAIGFLVARPFLAAIVLALVGGYLFQAPHARIVARVAKPRLSAALLVGAMLVAVVVPVAFVLTALARDGVAFAESGEWGAIGAALSASLGRVGVEDPDAALSEIFAGARSVAGAAATRAAVSGVEAVLGLFVFLFLLYFAILEGPAWIRFLRRVTPLEDAQTGRFLRESGRAVRAIFLGEVVIAAAQGLATGLGWWLFGFPNPLLWGVVATLLALLPFTGAPLAVVGMGLFAVLTGDPVRGAGFIAFGVLGVGLLDNLLRPWIVSRTGSIHPAIVLVGVLGGLVAFGTAGLFLGPLALALLRAALVARAEADGDSTPAM